MTELQSLQAQMSEARARFECNPENWSAERHMLTLENRMLRCEIRQLRSEKLAVARQTRKRRAA